MDENYARDMIRAGQRHRQLTAAAAATTTAVRQGGGAAEVLRLARMLNSRDPIVRQGAVKNLSRIGGRDAASFITRCLNDREVQVRLVACQALGYMRAHTAKPQLYDALTDRNADVRCAAALALANMGDKHGLPCVVRLVCKSGNHQVEALRILSRITGQKFLPTRKGLEEAWRWIKLRKKHFAKF